MNIEIKNNDMTVDIPNTFEIENGTQTVYRKDHSKLEKLDYENSGHTGFASQKTTGELNKLVTDDKTNLVNAINEIKENCDDAYAYNFTVVANSFVYNPKEAQALEYMVKNWQTKAMSLFVKGYPVVALDINNRHMKVLYKDRNIQTFTWEVHGLLTKCYIKPVSIRELVFKDEAEKYINDEISKLKKYIDEQIATLK